MNGKKSRRRVMSDEELTELIRYAVLERDGFDLSDEFGAAIYSTWYLMNPLSARGRDAIGSVTPYNDVLPKGKLKDAVMFTSHAHESEPQDASPDDLIIYSLLKSKKDGTVNFITDRFSCKKIL